MKMLADIVDPYSKLVKKVTKFKGIVSLLYLTPDAVKCVIA